MSCTKGRIRAAVGCCLPLQLLQCRGHQLQVLLSLVVQLPGNVGLFGGCFEPPTPPARCHELPDAGKLPALSASECGDAACLHSVDECGPNSRAYLCSALSCFLWAVTACSAATAADSACVAASCASAAAASSLTKRCCISAGSTADAQTSEDLYAAAQRTASCDKLVSLPVRPLTW